LWGREGPKRNIWGKFQERKAVSRKTFCTKKTVIMRKSTILTLLLAISVSSKPIPSKEDVVTLIREGSMTLVDTRDAQSRSVYGFLPESIQATEYSTESSGEVDIEKVIFLVNEDKIKREICTDDVRCYTGDLQEFSDMIIFPQDVKFNELEILLEEKRIVLIDVRRPEELVTDGRIPDSVNVPLQDIPEAFTLEKEEFKEKYGFQLPDKDAKNVVLTCRSGRRILKANKSLEKLGYKNLRLYRGSILDWKANNGPLL